jgi:hypothetical protein
MVAKRRFTAFEQPVRQPSDAGVVLGVHHHHDAFAPREFEDVEHFVIVELQSFVGQIQFDRGAALLDQLRQFLLQHFGSGIADDQMEAIVYMRLWPGALMVIVDNRTQRLSAHLHRKRQHRGVAAAQRRQGAAAKIVRGAAAGPRLLIHVAMAVGAAR